MKCEPEKKAFVAHCRQLQEQYDQERQRALELYGDPGAAAGEQQPGGAATAARAGPTQQQEEAGRAGWWRR
jgi:hypothetical protein